MPLPPRASSKYTGSLESRMQSAGSMFRAVFPTFSRIHKVQISFGPFGVLFLSLIPGLGSAFVRKSWWPLLYESLPAFGMLALLTWQVDGFLSMLLFGAMGTIAAINYQRACAQRGEAHLSLPRRLRTSLIYAAMYFIAMQAWVNFGASHLVQILQPMPTLAERGDRLFFWGSEYQRGDIVRTSYWIEVVAGLPGESVSLEQGILKVNGVELPKSDYGAISQLPGLALASGRWAVRQGAYLCLYPSPYRPGLEGVVLDEDRLLGRVVWKYRPGIGVIP